MGNIILASSSPRRRDFFEKYSMDFKILKSDIIETIDNKSPVITVMSLAFQKATNILEKTERNDIIIAADTIVYFDEKILVKPNNKEEARNMLKNLSGNTHYVYTGIAIIKVGTNEKIVDYSMTKVKFRKLDEKIIENYLTTKEYEDKAGSYGIQGKGEILIEEINGSYPNVVGLPIVKLDMLLKEYFKISLI
ncbi:MAG: nucleoside triphosphate pyrophosphatase [Senegalia sp. (in: firmicutes)]|uniref:nucleoside triphosphate pyrophosphatase n=1 Tax=Senegalia sp. (in: firmicutes) TaxID=1924098 RepID=UPI003F9AC11D